MFGPKFEKGLSRELPKNNADEFESERLNVLGLREKMDKTMSDIFRAMREKRSKGVVEKDEAIIEEQRKKLIEKFGDSVKIEMLNLKNDLTAWLVDLHQRNLVRNEEYKFLIDELNNKSFGRDNYTTLCLMKLFFELDLDLRERALNKELEKK